MIPVLGSIISWVLIVSGVLKTAVGFFIAFTVLSEDRASATARYLGSGTTGDHIDKGLVWFGVGVAFGLLVMIARGVTPKPDT